MKRGGAQKTHERFLRSLFPLFRANPKSELSKFINAYTSARSRLIKKEYLEVRQKLWKEMFWSQSFCLLSAGGAPIEVIRQYIETQGEGKSEHRVLFSDLPGRHAICTIY